MKTSWLSNGRYHLFLTGRGTGFSAWRDYLLTAWDADPVEDANGFFVFARDADSGEYWCVSGPPVPGQHAGEVTRDGAVARIRRNHVAIASDAAVMVPGDLPLELRRIQLHNTGERPRAIELTSYLEAVLAPRAAHAAHPAFSKLFVQTEWNEGLILARRRPRGNDERHPLMAHALLEARASAWETDRARFLGRGRDWTCAQALTGATPLSGTVGNVLDPVMSLRTAVTLQPGEKRSACFVLAAGEDREALSRSIAALRGRNLDEELADASKHAAPSALPEGEPWRSLAAGFDDGARVSSAPAAARRAGSKGEPVGAKETLRFFNGVGGFNADASEYVIRIGRDADGHLRLPPMPWSNVVANERCGFVVTEKGAGCLWSRNSREHRLTPWRNDPVADPHDDAFYIRDEASGGSWSVLPGPAPGDGDYEVRHGFGYSTWRHQSNGWVQEACLFVPKSDPLRIARIRVTNTQATARRVALYAYQRWVLGVLPEATRKDVRTRFDADRAAIVALNDKAGEFAGGLAFAAASFGDASTMSWTCDREAFLGRGGSMRSPAALSRADGLEGGIAEDPCAALRVEIEVAAGASVEVAFLAGEATSGEELDRILREYRAPGAIEAALRAARDSWGDTLGRMQVRTPDASIDVMVNGWLAYQNLACRMWARTAFYQSGGAFGFRDQLQDAAALIYLDPSVLRRQILLNAAHQFDEGDVLHWWHPPASRGVRTRFADDLLWLPYLTAFYIQSTGESAILSESVRFLSAAPLAPGEDEALLEPRDSGTSADLYEHCCRALDRSLTKGAHGLPLFGSGDWNDGMNRVGREGRGESVWMGFFLFAILEDFLPFCEERGDAGRIARYREYRADLGKSLEESGWDGEWYRRAYYDDGTPLGSRESDECRIDALAQAWAVISKAAPAERAGAALDALERTLISDADGIIRLLAPPFVDTPHDPGYIKGYVAGVRENGGQYTHAALWVVKAMAEAGRRERAAQLLAMLSPVNHALDAQARERYKVEPYVVAADVYGAPPHVGRGGWTWYTGSAGWMYRVAIESILGFTLEDGEAIRIDPRIPDGWPGFEMDYRPGAGVHYRIEVANPQACAQRVVSASLDGGALAVGAQGVRIPLLRDGARHRVAVVLGR